LVKISLGSHPLIFSYLSPLTPMAGFSVITGVLLVFPLPPPVEDFFFSHPSPGRPYASVFPGWHPSYGKETVFFFFEGFVYKDSPRGMPRPHIAAESAVLYPIGGSWISFFRKRGGRTVAFLHRFFSATITFPSNSRPGNYLTP